MSVSMPKWKTKIVSFLPIKNKIQYCPYTHTPIAHPLQTHFIIVNVLSILQILTIYCRWNIRQSSVTPLSKFVLHLIIVIIINRFLKLFFFHFSLHWFRLLRLLWYLFYGTSWTTFRYCGRFIWWFCRYFIPKASSYKNTKNLEVKWK